MELKDKLVFLRKKSGLSQAILAEKLTVSRQTVSNWELGEIIPSTDNLVRLSKLYGVSLDYLVSDVAEPPAVAVAVAEKPGEQIMESPHRKTVLTGVAVGLAIALLLALLYFVFSIGYDKGVKDATPTYPVHSDILEDSDFEEPGNLISW